MVDDGVVDGGMVDGETVDGGTLDGGTLDGGTVDGGTVDGGTVDTVAVEDEEVRVEQIRVKDLHAYACAMYERSGPEDVIPIPKHLGLAQSHNPYADADDVGLIVVSVGDRCAGYIGAVPGLLRRGEQCSKVLYLSSFYLDASYRGRGLGKLLVRSLMSLPADLSGCSMSDDARYVYNSTGILGAIGPRQDALLDLRRLRSKVNRVIATVLGGDRPDRRTASVADKLQRANGRYLYPVLRRLFYFAMPAFGRSGPKDLAMEESDRIATDALNGARPSQSAVFHRGVDWINWRLEYPWILNYSDTEDRYENYFFRSVQPFFKVFALNLHGKERSDRRGFVVLSISVTEDDTTLKVLDHHFTHPPDAACLTDIVAAYGRRYGVDRVYMPQHLARPLEKNLVARSFLLPSMHEYVTRPVTPDSPLARSIDHIELDACDGDFAFT